MDMEFAHCFRDELNYIKRLSAESSHYNLELHEFLSSFENDSDIEYLFENFAFLMAKLHQKLDESFPEISQNLLSKVFPTPIRPIPSTAILQFAPKSSDVYHLKKHAEVKSKFTNNEQCTYQIIRDISIIPLEVKSCNLVNSFNGCKIVIQLKWNGKINEDGVSWQPIPITFFLSPYTYTANLLKLWFEQHLKRITLINDNKTFNLSKNVIKNFIPAIDDLVVPLEVTQFWRLQLLQQYFYIPHVNNFITLDIKDELNLIRLDESKIFSMVFQFDEPLMINNNIDISNAFFVNCVPIVNLFQRSSAFNFVELQSNYLLEFENEDNLFKINNIHSPLEPSNQKKRGGRKEYLPITKFTASTFGGDNQIYYQILLKSNVAGKLQNNITFIDGNGNKLKSFISKNYICDATLTNGKKVNDLEVGDICMPTLSIPNDLKFYNITKPTIEIPPLHDSYQHWAIISHLSLSPIFLGDIEAIKQFISDFNYYSLSNSQLKKICDKRLQGVIDINYRLIDWIIDGIMKRGIELIFYFDIKYFEDEGDMYQFGWMLAHVLPFCVAGNNFLITKIADSKTNKVWHLGLVSGSRNQF